jgi:hypothetical protein
MPNSSNPVFSGSDLQQFGDSYSRIAARLPLDVKRKLVAVFRSYFAAYGLDGVYERLNGRTVAQVLDEYKQPDRPAVIAEGELDGVRYTLYDAPPNRNDSI